ncbi:flagellar biosynthetic protein flip [Azospirillum thiophilum]|uniref:Flagellar biosynthetic protein FliP n=1 Tax=Azospirillum thiophilum TaxID=528244 RepID=A0AAC8W4E6_9PROT|nr:flagellar type III secretion system pore protein FliP [Azospirillum thiophilum]ALG74929.1 flagellar biosynthetic protein flip [Azospirillum thiophilum]KJR62316.1 flagellar biosynthetic protein flip [Azospirillum thiophilum]
MRFRILVPLLALTLAAVPAAAAPLDLDLGALGSLADGASLSGRIVQGIVLLTVLSVAPGLLIMVTCFTRIIVVLSLLRSALGLQQSPPNMVLVSLAMFLTFHIMGPVIDSAWQDGLRPLLNEQVTQEQGLERMIEPFRGFMASHVRERDLAAFAAFTARPKPEGETQGGEPAKDERPVTAESVDLRLLMPAFLLSELRRAFEIGFLLFLPFLVIDMVVAAILMAMGMMMLPPVMIALPFKIIFFVLTDGWFLIAGSLIRSYGT